MHNHNHTPPRQSTLYLAAGITLSFALIEAGVGWWSNSLALVSDAGHMLTDTTALLIASLGAWFATRRASRRFSYGFGKMEFIAAFVNGLLMLAVVTAVVYHAIERFSQPLAVKGEAVTAVALVGLLLNAVVLYLLGHGEADLNRRAAILHVMADLLASVAALASGVIILLTDWSLVDPILSLVIVVLILYSTFRLIREAAHGLLAGVPLGLSLETIGRDMAAVNGVTSVHDLHIWALTSNTTALSAHVVIEDLSQWDFLLTELRNKLKQSYDIEHVTLQPEVQSQSLLSNIKEPLNQS